jgi:hypothetical protein
MEVLMLFRYDRLFPPHAIRRSHRFAGYAVGVPKNHESMQLNAEHCRTRLSVIEIREDGADS